MMILADEGSMRSVTDDRDDDREFALEEAEHAMRQLADSALDARDWDESADLLDALHVAIATGDADAIHRATGRVAVLLAVRQPPRIQAREADGEERAPEDVLERINELVHAVVVRRDEDAGMSAAEGPDDA